MTTTIDERRGSSATRSLIRFTAVALPAGWIFLSIPLLTELPVEPFVLATLVVGLVVPALVLTRRETGSVRPLLADAVRLPRPWLLLPALLVIPATSWLAAGAAGTEITTDLLLGLAVNVGSSVLIVNLWEEMAWAGFVQRRAATRWGIVGGALVTALLFVGIHVPLAFYGADTAGDVFYNIAMMVGSGIGMRLLIAAFDQWGRGSILVLGVLHASFNATSDLLEPGHDWVRYAVTLALGVAAIAAPSVRRPAADLREVSR